MWNLLQYATVAEPVGHHRYDDNATAPVAGICGAATASAALMYAKNTRAPLRFGGR
jgi:hypothetical protein